MQNFINRNISDIVAEDYRAATVFKKYDIDYCCNGQIPLKSVCESQNIDPEKLIHDLTTNQAETNDPSSAFNTWPIGLLAEYIERKHHHYVETKIPEIKANIEKICQVHGQQHSELLEIKEIFFKAAGELSMHMKKEELMLFPFIKKMEKEQKASSAIIDTIENPIEVMKHEHNDEGEYFRKISHLSNGYSPPENACNTYRVTYAMLKEFEEDLHLHIHLENNILFPKAIELEKELN